jgi:hypothetical protein
LPPPEPSPDSARGSNPQADPEPPSAPEAPAPAASSNADDEEKPRGETKKADDASPPARTGFQMSIRTGYALPFGSTGGNAEMSDTFGGQVPLSFNLGAKITERIYLGAYLGFGFGGVSGDFEKSCNDVHYDCSSMSVRMGLEIQYAFMPRQKTNPWIGYGIGFEGTGARAKKNGVSYDYFYFGPDYAHLMGGVDFRLSSTFGLGPYLDFSVGRYDTVTIETPTGTIDGRLLDKSLHEWLTLGVRAVFFP